MSGEKKTEEPSSEEHKAEPKESHPSSLGKVNEEGIFVLSLTESTKISKKFESLKAKRARLLSLIPKKKVLVEEKPDFRPSLDKNSQKILMKKRGEGEKVDKATELI